MASSTGSRHHDSPWLLIFMDDSNDVLRLFALLMDPMPAAFPCRPVLTTHYYISRRSPLMPAPRWVTQGRRRAVGVARDRGPAQPMLRSNALNAACPRK